MMISNVSRKIFPPQISKRSQQLSQNLQNNKPRQKAIQETKKIKQQLLSKARRVARNKITKQELTENLQIMKGVKITNAFYNAIKRNQIDTLNSSQDKLLRRKAITKLNAATKKILAYNSMNSHFYI